MKILTTYSHQTRIHNFGNLNHDFYIPSSEAAWTDSAKGDYKYCYPDEPIPDNLHFDETVKSPDITLGVGGDIRILHALHTNFDKDAFNIYQSERQIALNPPKNSNWHLIRHGVDTERFKGWEGGENVITLFNNLYGRNTTKNKTKKYADKLKEEFGDKFKLYGYKNEDGYIPHQEVDKELRQIKAYLHIRTRGFAPFNVAEALCTGCPVISAPNPTVDDDLIPGYNGIITRNVVEAIKNLTQKCAERLSKNARSLGVKRFSLEENLERWNYVFNRVKHLKQAG